METEAATACQLAPLADTDINWDMHIIRSDGIPGIFRGFGTSAVGSLPSIVLALTSLEAWNLGYSDNVDKKSYHMQMVVVQAIVGLAAGTCSSVIDDYGVGRPSVLKTTKMLLREDGWKGFYRGFGPRFLNMSFYGTMIVTYEIISLCLSLDTLKDNFEMRSSEYLYPNIIHHGSR
ncbi:hypothetical protein KY290_001241 [Solanum tuberosum]|uniref:Mitochondrial carrier protein n=1 Tax=Solanum tuberosum TaxID=4113 RepID=A0ABQ7WLN4_SOLTU|nr:hypothetical protein KY290_001241 [Solanum tuberosum]